MKKWELKDVNLLRGVAVGEPGNRTFFIAVETERCGCGSGLRSKTFRQ